MPLWTTILNIVYHCHNSYWYQMQPRTFCVRKYICHIVVTSQLNFIKFPWKFWIFVFILSLIRSEPTFYLSSTKDMKWCSWSTLSSNFNCKCCRIILTGIRKVFRHQAYEKRIPIKKNLIFDHFVKFWEVV